MIKRENYLKLLIAFKDKDLIKVVTGIRRCGKSTLFELFGEYLIKTGVSKNNIISVNLEDPLFDEVITYKDLFDYIESKLKKDNMNYVFIDEVQRIENFEKACNYLYTMKNVDLYITGSNAKLLSGELATYLSGRYVEIKMMPLSFKEYISEVGKENLSEKYKNYLINSSFPYTLSLNSKEEIKIYLESIFNSIIIKDILTRKPTLDVSSLQLLVKFMFDNIGNISSSNKIANTMISSGKKISVPTIENYLDLLVSSFILFKAERYDIKGKQYLSSGYKYYVSDIGLRYYLLGEKNVDRGHILENIVYLELIRRGYTVYVGKLEQNEIDFIAINKEREEEYFQVSYTVESKETLDRELKPLENLNDNYKKYLLTMDENTVVSHNGIKQIYVLDWLL